MAAGATGDEPFLDVDNTTAWDSAEAAEDGRLTSGVTGASGAAIQYLCQWLGRGASEALGALGAFGASEALGALSALAASLDVGGVLPVLSCGDPQDGPGLLFECGPSSEEANGTATTSVSEEVLHCVVAYAQDAVNASLRALACPTEGTNATALDAGTIGAPGNYSSGEFSLAAATAAFRMSLFVPVGVAGIAGTLGAVVARIPASALSSLTSVKATLCQDGVVALALRCSDTVVNSTAVAALTALDAIRALNSSDGNWTMPAPDEAAALSCSLAVAMAEPVRRLRPFTFEWGFLFVLAFIVAGVVGNVLVCLAIILDRRLHNTTNYFLLSLAVADLLVSLFVMPLGAIPGFLGYWPLGFTWCSVYATCDVLACSASILHMCFISLGRYLGIRNPLATRRCGSTMRIVTIKITAVWLLAMLISSSITVLGMMNPKNIMPEEGQCVINNRAFFVFGSLAAFYIPMLVMVVTFVLTVQLLREKARFAVEGPVSDHWSRLGGRFAAVKRRPNRDKSAKDKDTSSCEDGEQKKKGGSFTMFRYAGKKDAGQKKSTRKEKAKAGGAQPGLGDFMRGPAPGGGGTAIALGLALSRKAAKEEGNASGNGNGHVKEGKGKGRLRNLRINLHVTPSSLNLRFLQNRGKRQSLALNAVATEQKASKVLGLVFFTFVLCWGPFFMLNMVFAACPDCQSLIPAHLVDTCLWLGYVSSTINPIIYTIFNRTFRAAFGRLLSCRYESLMAPPRYLSVTERGDKSDKAGPSRPPGKVPAGPSFEPVAGPSGLCRNGRGGVGRGVAVLPLSMSTATTASSLCMRTPADSDSDSDNDEGSAAIGGPVGGRRSYPHTFDIEEGVC